MSYRSIYLTTLLLFIMVIFIALTFLDYAEKEEKKAKSVEGDYQRKVTLIKIVDDPDKEKEKSEAPAEKERQIPVINNEVFELNRLGNDAYNKADYDKAFIHFYQAYSIDKENKVIKRNLYNTLVAKGDERVRQNRYDEAIESFKKGLEYIDDDYAAYRGIGFSYLKLKDFENAIKNFLSAYELKNDSDDLKMEIAGAYFEIKDYENSKKFIGLIENKGKYSSDIDKFIEILDKNIDDTKGKTETTTSHFNVYYDGYEDPVTGNLVSMILEEVYYSIGREFDHYPDEKVTVILYTEKQFDENIGIPDWAGALFDGKIRLPGGGIKGRSDKLQEVLKHEYTHAAIYSKVGKNCPVWLNEGLAQVLSSEKQPKKEEMAFFLKNKKLPELSDLENSFLDMDNEDAMVSYIISMLFTQHIINKFGMSSINRFLDVLKEGKQSKKAFEEVFYDNSERFYQDFLEGLNI